MLLLVAGALWIMASQRTPAEATAHARDELANCVAQGKCPTATPSPSRTPTPAPTATPLPTSTSLPDSPTPTPAPSLPIPAEGSDWLSGYLRPSDWNDGATLELALPTGRWYVRLDDPTCAGPWTNVVLAPDAQLVVSATADHLSWVATCNLIGASWQSDTPCALDEDGLCDVLSDTSYWDMLGRLPTLEPTATPVPVPNATVSRRQSPQPVALAPARSVAPAAPPTPRVSADIAPAVASPTDRESAIPRPTLTPVPTFTATTQPATRIPTTTPHPIVVSAASPPNIPSPIERIVSWTGLSVIIGTLTIVGAAGYGIYRWQRPRYESQIAALDAERD